MPVLITFAFVHRVNLLNHIPNTPADIGRDRGSFHPIPSSPQLRYTAYIMDITQKQIDQLVRRRALLARITSARNKTERGSPEADRLEVACAKAVKLLSQSATVILESEKAGFSSQNDNSIMKWRIRLAKELVALRRALTYLLRASISLSLATSSDVVSLPRSNSSSMSYYKNAGVYIDKARQTCTFVSREIAEDVSTKLLTYTISRRNHAHESLARIADVYRKVNSFETKATEQLAFLAATEAEMVLSREKSTIQQTMIRRNSTAQLPDLKRALCLLMTLA